MICPKSPHRPKTPYFTVCNHFLSLTCPLNQFKSISKMDVEVFYIYGKHVYNKDSIIKKVWKMVNCTILVDKTHMSYRYMQEFINS